MERELCHFVKIFDMTPLRLHVSPASLHTYQGGMGSAQFSASTSSTTTTSTRTKAPTKKPTIKPATRKPTKRPTHKPTSKVAMLRGSDVVDSSNDGNADDGMNGEGEQ